MELKKVGGSLGKLKETRAGLRELKEVGGGFARLVGTPQEPKKLKHE